tara:strand:+ start:123 stop:485 length:363 start_codon:yes stop_codon:yes gene_type:complete
MYPRLFHHLEAKGVRAVFYVTQWFRTFFLYTERMDLSFRALDCFCFGGLEALFCIGFAILEKLEVQLLQHNFMEIVMILSKLEDVDIGEVFARASEIELPSNLHLTEELEMDYIYRFGKC